MAKKLRKIYSGEEETPGIMTMMLFLLEIVMVFLYIIFLTDLASAEEIRIDYPLEVNLGEEFDVEIHVASEYLYDVKVFVLDPHNEKIISQVFNQDDWKNPFYYLDKAFPSEKSFKNRINNYTGEAEICVRLRRSGQKSYSEKCGAITVTNLETNVQTKSNNSINGKKRIILGSSHKEQIAKEEFFSKDYHVRKVMFYLFVVFFCLAAIYLLVKPESKYLKDPIP